MTVAEHYGGLIMHSWKTNWVPIVCILSISAAGLWACQAASPSDDIQKMATANSQPPKWEYASFYAEVAGDFANPINSDAPSQYVWTTVDASVTSGNISEIYKHLGLAEDSQGSSQNEIEVQIITSLSYQGWQLEHATSYSVRSKREDIQTVYRYIFRRPKR